MIRAAVILTVGLSLVASDALAQSPRGAIAPGRASVAKQTGLPGTGGGGVAVAVAGDGAKACVSRCIMACVGGAGAGCAAGRGA